MRKICFFVLILTLFVLSACGGNSSEGKNNTSKDGVVELNLWHADTGERVEIYNEAAERFEENNPGTKVNVLDVANDDYKQRLVVAMSGGNAPDVFASWGGGWLEEFVNSDQVLDLTDEDIDFDNFLEATLDNATYDDKIYGLPLGVSTYAFFYNKELFEENGLEVPETYDDLLMVIDELKKQDIVPIAQANQTKWPGALFLTYLADRIGGEEAFANAYERNNGGSFEDDAFIEAGKYIQELVDIDAFNSGFNGVPYDSGQARQLMYTDQAGMMLQTAYFVNHVNEEFPEFKEKMGVFKFPAINNGKGDPTNIGAGVSPTWSIKADTEHPDLALELVKELTSVETAQQVVDRAGSAVAVKGVEIEDEFVQEFANWIEDANSIQFPYDQTLPPELAELHLDTTYELFGKTMSPEEAAKEMEEKAKEILD